MTRATKWKAVASGLLALALVGGSAVAANAAPGDPLNPQPNGSEGPLYIMNGDTGEVISDSEKVFDRAETILGSGSATDYLAPILGTPANTTASTQGYVFLASETNVRKGVVHWEAYDNWGPLGSTKAIVGSNLTVGSLGFGNGTGLDGVFQNVGGTYYLGVAFTKNSGVTVDSAVYRTVTILAGNKFTVSPIAVEGAAPAPTAPTQQDLAANPGKQVANLVAPVDADSTIIAINAGVANANKTLNVGAYSTYTDLGTVTLDANGEAAIDVAGTFTDNSEHTLVLWESDGTLVAYGTFQMNYTSVTSGTNPVTVDVTTSNKFELVAPAAGTIDLGDVRRNQTTTPVALGQFTVIDDRSNALGWDLNVSANDFVSGTNTISKAALGYSPVAVSTLPTGVTLGAAKLAGAGTFGVVASGAAGSSTTEAGLAFNLDLTFKSPVDAAVGTYTSTVSLDLVSK